MEDFISANDVMFRICYKNGTPVKGKEIYESQKLCKCYNCVNRNRYNRGTWNQVTAWTKDIARLNDLADFLKGWECKSETPIKTTYYDFDSEEN